MDQTPFGLGRYVPRVLRIAKESGIQVVVSTGLYTFNDMPTFFKMGIKELSPTFLQDFMIKEIEEGISDTGIKPAILKCATEHQGLTKDVEFVLRATAQVHLRTGVLISTHSDSFSKQGLAQQRIFKEEGVDLSRVLIGHVGDTTDIEYIEQILAQGSYIGMDRFGINRMCPFKDRLATVVELCKRGYASKMLLSHDMNCESDHLSREMTARVPGYNESRKFTYISDVVLPALLEAGVSQDDIDQMMIRNPREFFELSGTY